MLRKGTKVEWNWSGGTARGKIAEIFRARVTRTIASASITRNASPAEPAYLVEQEDGAKALKSRSELRRVSS